MVSKGLFLIDSHRGRAKQIFLGDVTFILFPLEKRALENLQASSRYNITPCVNLVIMQKPHSQVLKHIAVRVIDGSR